jgi:Fic family protein
MTYKPPFRITPLILKYSQDIARGLGIIVGRKLAEIPLSLRKTLNITTIQASLSIEGNTLSIDQVTDLLDGKRVIGPPKDILEAQNAFSLYQKLPQFDVFKIKSLLQAHEILMQGLIEENGKWRSGDVGILKGNRVSHIAPPPKMVPNHMNNLFDFLRQDSDISWLIKACIFHYELEFIHPFADGNGRIGRFWQQLILTKEDPVFEFIPVEVLIKDHQADYYRVLEECDKLGESTPFIEFSLSIIHSALVSYGESVSRIADDFSTRLSYAKVRIISPWFSRKDYLRIHPDISTATASRDLLLGLQKGLLKSQGDHNQMRYCFI